MKNSKLTFLSLFTSLGLVLSYIEMQIPYFLPVPGIKLGLANIMSIVVLYAYGLRETLLISILRIIIINVLFGTIVSFLYAFTGGILSLFVMFLLKKITNCSKKFISIMGAISHNIGQILIAIMITETKEIIYYLPVLIIAGLISGLIIGIIGDKIYEKSVFLIKN